MANFTKGYVSSTPESARAPKRPSDDTYEAPASMATALKNRWKGSIKPFPYGENDEGGGGGGDA
jgi:hypothetical protein